MLKMLQRNERGTRKMSTTIRPVELIIDGAYADRAVKAINDAQTDIRICAYDWRWYDGNPEISIQRLNIAIIKAVKRGLRVKALVNSEQNYLILKALGVDCRFVGSERILHVKAISVQETCLLIGSHNMTKRANSANYEASVIIFEPDVIIQFNEYFDNIWEYSQGGF